MRFTPSPSSSCAKTEKRVAGRAKDLPVEPTSGRVVSGGSRAGDAFVPLAEGLAGVRLPRIQTSARSWGLLSLGR